MNSQRRVRLVEVDTKFKTELELLRTALLNLLAKILLLLINWDFST